MAVKSLKGRQHNLADSKRQLEYLSKGIFAPGGLPTFETQVKTFQDTSLRPKTLEILQINLGYMCNQVCAHCHVDAGPDRKEMMSRTTMEQELNVTQNLLEEVTNKLDIQTELTSNLEKRLDNYVNIVDGLEGRYKVQEELTEEFKKALKKDFDIDFNQLFTITNLPISRFLAYLIASENYEDYMQRLVEAFNPAAVAQVMCTNTLSVSWDGFLYDCDFNQMLELKVASPVQHLNDFDLDQLQDRFIRVSQHCYGCTAGAGSSCQGSTV